MFNQVDKAWKEIMRKVQDRPNAMKCATATGTLETLQSCNVSLEKIQKCLEVFTTEDEGIVRVFCFVFLFLTNTTYTDILSTQKGDSND